MKRRQLIKRVGAATMVGSAGLASTASAERIEPGTGDYVVTEIDGERRTMTAEEFEAHPETTDIGTEEKQKECGFRCCECCEQVCPYSPCECDEQCGYCTCNTCRD